MPTKSTAKHLDSVISKLQRERQQHAEAIAEIDALCSEYGIELPEQPRRRKVGRPRKTGKRTTRRGPATRKRKTAVARKRKKAPARKKAGKRKKAGRRKVSKKKVGRKKVRRAGKRTTKSKRGRKAMSGPQSILAFVQKAGRGGAKSADIAKHWNSQGRGGSVFVVLSKMIAADKLKKRNLEGQRGSVYHIA